MSENFTINLSDSDFESNEFRPFNNGNAGIVPVTISNVSKEVVKNYWVIVFRDKNGAEMRDFQSYLDANHSNAKEILIAQGKILRHYWEVIVGKVEAPLFKSPIEMLDGVMEAISTHSKGKIFNLAVDYGYGEKHNEYLNRKKYIPFIENASTGESNLYLSRNAYRTPLNVDQGSADVKSKEVTSFQKFDV